DIKTGFLCNNNCLFCVQASNKLKGNRSFEDITKDLIESRKTCDEVVFTGGEVTIRKDFFELVKLAKLLNYKNIQIQSNGRMFFSKEFCQKTIEAGATEFSPAIHGYNAKQHDYLTKAPGSFEQAVKGIINLKNLGQKIIMNCVVCKENYKDLPKVAELFAKLKVDQFQFAFMHAMGNAEENFDTLMPNMTQCSTYIKKGLDIGRENKIMCMVESLPFCLMRGYEDHISESYIPQTQIRGVNFQNTDDFKTLRQTQGKAKFTQCHDCRFQHICEGPWREYPEKLGDKEFLPVPFQKFNENMFDYIELVKKKGINVPEIIKIGNNYILEWIEGNNLETKDIFNKNYSASSQVLNFFKKIHSENLREINQESFKIKQKEKISELIENSYFDEKEKIQLRKLLIEDFPQIYFPDLTHGNLNKRNLILDRNNNIYLIDFKNVGESFLELDLLSFLDSKPNWGFLEEYSHLSSRHKKISESLLKNKNFFRILFCLNSGDYEKIRGILKNG
ncbi:MAG: radical SAM protein, partial [Nanoarchaeota archaeon]